MSYASMMQYKRKGEQYFRQGEFIHAEKAFNSALEEARLYQPANEYTAQQLKVMSTFYLTIGIYAKAEHYLIQALEIEENLVEQESMKIVETLNMLGLLYHLWKDYSRAEVTYRRAIKLEKQAQYLRYPQYDSNLMHQTHHHLAMVLCAQGRQNEAFPVCSSTCANEISTRGPRASSLSTDLHNLAVQYCSQNRVVELQKINRWVLDLALEQLQKKYLDSTFREAIQNRQRLTNTTWFNAQYESLISMDEVWRPSVVYRHPENSLNRLEQHIADPMSNRGSSNPEDSWRPNPSLTARKN
ncbi:MAG: tetratricopeptide repeat protein [bacterium]